MYQQAEYYQFTKQSHRSNTHHSSHQLPTQHHQQGGSFGLVYLSPNIRHKKGVDTGYFFKVIKTGIVLGRGLLYRSSPYLLVRGMREGEGI